MTVMVKFKSVEEVGVVKSARGTVAIVLVQKKSACEGCSSGICKPADQSMEIEALNPLHAHAGQKVRVVIHTAGYMKGTLIVYGIPLLSLIAGAIFGRELSGTFLKNFDPDSVSAVFGFSALVVSFFIIKVWSSKAEKNAGMKPVIEEIIE